MTTQFVIRSYLTNIDALVSTSHSICDCSSFSSARDRQTVSVMQVDYMCSTRVITYSFLLNYQTRLASTDTAPLYSTCRNKDWCPCHFLLYVCREDERFEKWPELLMSNGRDRELYIYYTPPSMADQEVMTC